MFCFFPVSQKSSAYTDKNSPFARLTNNHSQFGAFSQPCSTRTFWNCLSHNSPAKGWPHKFCSRGTIGSSMLYHDFDHLCRGRRIQISGRFEFATILEHRPFWPGYKQILRPLLVLHILTVLIWYSILLQSSLVMLMIPAQWILHVILDHLTQTSEYNSIFVLLSKFSTLYPQLFLSHVFSLLWA